MTRITTKEYIAAKQMKKNGDCIPGDKPGGAVSVCVTGEGVKSNEYKLHSFRHRHAHCRLAP